MSHMFWVTLVGSGLLVIILAIYAAMIGLIAWTAVAGAVVFLGALLTGRLFRKPPYGEGGSG